MALTLHVHGGITGALFYALAPMVSEADAVAEAEAKALVAFLTRTFLEHYQDSLDQFPTALLIAAKDGGKEAEVQAKFVGAVEAISYHIAKYRGFRSTLRRRAVQAAAAAASARPGSPAAAAASGGLPSGGGAAGAHARSETAAPSVPHRRSASMVPASQLSSGGSEMPPSPSAAGVPHTALNTPKRRTQGKATLDSFRDTESSGSLSGSEQGGGHGAEDGTGADSDSSGLGPGTVPTPQVTPARWHPKRTTGLPEPRSLDFKQEDEVGDGPPAQATARAQAAAPPPVPPTD